MIVRNDAEVEDVSSLTSPSMKDPRSDHCIQDSDATDNIQLRSSARVAKKYGLRPRNLIGRLQLGRTREDAHARATKSSSRLRPRPAPLSKYRRKSANARERHRMKEINKAFETLRRILPAFCSRRAASSMTKITTLKLAVSYIRALSRILEDGHPSDITFFDGLSLEEVSVSRHGPFTNTHFGVNHHHSLIGHSSGTSMTQVTLRPSSGSYGDLEDLLPDDSCVLEDSFIAFDDIQTLPEMDALSLLMVQDINSPSAGS
ncbi:helix-loop-helix protein delilah-like [Macrobrachium rosenbergii]|uniref:helix-loop-helix protein delilah-like n=1 Tax=Macrobrachium rosenbergii TaxID=79674 RepID=UPI0034D5B106